MDTLLLRLVGPMQSWGIDSRFTVRHTGREPSKSGVIGLLCAALGRPRTAPLGDLAALRMGVRVDQEGTIQVDYHTAQQVYKASGGPPKATEVSHRYYLADARFLVGLAGQDGELLKQIHEALADPVWPLYLGRRAFVPSQPVWLADGLRTGETLEGALQHYPYLGKDTPPARLRFVLEDPNGPIVRPDLPLSFALRRFAPRRVRIEYRPAPTQRQEVT